MLPDAQLRWLFRQDGPLITAPGFSLVSGRMNFGAAASATKVTGVVLTGFEYSSNAYDWARIAANALDGPPLLPMKCIRQRQTPTPIRPGKTHGSETCYRFR